MKQGEIWLINLNPTIGVVTSNSLKDIKQGLSIVFSIED